MEIEKNENADQNPDTPPWYLTSSRALEIREGFRILAEETKGMTEEELQEYFGDDFVGGGCH